MDDIKNSGFKLTSSQPTDNQTGASAVDSSDELIISAGSQTTDEGLEPLSGNANNAPISGSQVLDEGLEPMSGTQKIVIGLACVGFAVVVAFLIMYWFLGFRFK